jgi:hypothetical protein
MIGPGRNRAKKYITDIITLDTPRFTRQVALHRMRVGRWSCAWPLMGWRRLSLSVDYACLFVMRRVCCGWLWIWLGDTYDPLLVDWREDGCAKQPDAPGAMEWGTTDVSCRQLGRHSSWLLFNARTHLICA